MSGSALRIASYNVHGCRGPDGRRDVERVAAVIRSLDADVVGLQEVDSRGGAGVREQLERLAHITGAHAIEGPTLRDELGAEYGNAVLCREPPSRVRRLDLSVEGHEPRGALAGCWPGPHGEPIEIAVTHFGLRRRERAAQLIRLLGWLDAGPTACGIVADWNEWRPLAAFWRALGPGWRLSRHRPSFPARWPVFALDRIAVSSRLRIERTRIIRNALTRSASDHLPVVCDVAPSASR